MKSNWLFIIVLLSYFISANAQTYFPFANSAANARWSIEEGYWGVAGQTPNGIYFYGIMGDTIFNSNVYSKVYRCGWPFSSDTAFNTATATYSFALREENKKIYTRTISDTIERIHYDFNLAVGDSFFFYYAPNPGKYVVRSVDSVPENGTYRRTIHFDAEYWIEGIGSVSGLYGSNFLIGNLYSLLLCYGHNDSTILSTAGYCYRSTGTGLKENTIRNSVKVYPNPVKNQLYISTENNSTFAFILYDLTLNKILYKEFTRSAIINTSQLVKGIYFYEISNETGLIKTGKLILN